MGVISYPRPLFANPEIRNFYEPPVRQITAVSQGKTTTVTTESEHYFVIGQLVRLIIPVDYGMREINGKEAYVISLPSTTQVELKLNTNGFTPFTNPDTSTTAQIIGIGDIRNGVISTTGQNVPSTAIPGSFINISPQETT